MPKLSFMKWYPADWINDTRALSAEAKGCWIDILCLMWNGPKRGVWSGTYQEFARVTGTPWEIAPRLIQELGKVSLVTFRDTEVTVHNRRMIRQETHYKSHAIRQRAYIKRRANDKKVTDKTLDSSRLLNSTKTTSLQRSRTFVKPTVGEVTAYGASIGFRVNAAAFCDFYESKGWKVGNTPMKSWQAAVRTWARKEREDNPSASNGGTSISEQVAKRLRTSGTTQERTEPTPGEILARIRDLPSVQSKA